MLNLRQLGQTLNNNNNINILLSFHAHGFVLVGKRIVIKIKSLINSAALKKTQTHCRHIMSFSAAEQVCLQVSCKSCRRDSDERRRSVGRLFQMSGLETAKFLRPMVVAVRLHTQFARGSRPQMPTSSKLNHRLAKLSQIRGASPRRHY